jgi:glycosyltransferase involved in cell wall biosynthesis
LPVILQRHNFIARKTGGGPLEWIKRQWKLRSLASLSGLTFVSQVTLDAFRDQWPQAKALPTAVIPNGAYFDVSPSEERTREILCVGRASPEKGILPAVQAISRVLSRHPDWFATILLSESAAHMDYAHEIHRAATSAGDRIHLRYDVPHDIVKAHNAQAAIAVIPSIWQEPFGRTALEAHEGGAAVISSGTGGLREISGPHALYLNEVTPATIESALCALIEDPAYRHSLAELGRQRGLFLFRISKVAADLDAFLESCVAHAKRKERQ